ncbi:MAG: MmcQ/YjbR family DNA-binding protein [Fimbriimonas sp.]|nr:MmcQ/YjbR family DNA-binding protein [Fimbriimonas sp.]
MPPDIQALFDRAREMCLSHQGVSERQSHGSPAFFVNRGGQFAALWHNHHDDGRTALMIALPPGMQEGLIASNLHVFYRPPYFGPSGWVGVHLDRDPDWDQIEDLVKTGFEYLTAKRRR